MLLDERMEAIIIPCACNKAFAHRTCFMKYKKIVEIQQCENCLYRFTKIELLEYPASFIILDQVFFVKYDITNNIDMFIENSVNIPHKLKKF